MDLILNILYDTLFHSTPVILLVIGGVYAYKSNVLNIALEGMLLMGAFTASLVIYSTGSVWAGLVVAIIANIVLALVFSYFSVTRKGNPIIVGISINLLVGAIAAFILKIKHMAIINFSSVVDLAAIKIDIPIIKNIPLLGDVISGHPLVTYLSILLIFVFSAIMYKTKFGIYVRVVGENEEAASSIGINVNKIRYYAVILGAVTAALAGFNLAVERLALFTTTMSAGRGFIAIAAIYCGRGKPGRSSIYAIVFGLAKALAINLKLYAGPASGLFEAIPYVVMVVVLVFASYVENRNRLKRGYENE